MKHPKNWKYKGLIVALLIGLLCNFAGSKFTLVAIAIILVVINHNILVLFDKEDDNEVKKK